LTEQFTGYYYLAHASTLLFAIGDPSIDLKDGSHDARKRFNEQHGSLQGLYFGMVIGEHEALFYPKEMST
jgi:hypothetical protein